MRAKEHPRHIGAYRCAVGARERAPGAIQGYDRRQGIESNTGSRERYRVMTRDSRQAGGFAKQSASLLAASHHLDPITRCSSSFPNKEIATMFGIRVHSISKKAGMA